MTRENAIEAVEKILNDAGLSEVVSITSGRSGIRGEAQCVYIKPFLVKGNGDVIKKLKAIPNFHGNKSLNFEDIYEFYGWFEIV